MHIRRIMLTSLAVVVALAAIAMAGDSKDDLKKRFKERHDKLVEMKEDGKIGETYLGYVEAVKNEYAKDDAVKKLITAENEDRRKLHAILAEEEGTSVEDVARQSAIFKFRKAGLEEWFKAKDGVWRQKKDMLKKAD